MCTYFSQFSEIIHHLFCSNFFVHRSSTVLHACFQHLNMADMQTSTQKLYCLQLTRNFLFFLSYKDLVIKLHKHKTFYVLRNTNAFCSIKTIEVWFGYPLQAKLAHSHLIQPTALNNACVNVLHKLGANA